LVEPIHDYFDALSASAMAIVIVAGLFVKVMPWSVIVVLAFAQSIRRGWGVNRFDES